MKPIANESVNEEAWKYQINDNDQYSANWRAAWLKKPSEITMA